MARQLYRFRIAGEETQHILIAVDEATGGEIRLVEIRLDSRKRSAQVTELLKIAEDRSVERFTAEGCFYFAVAEKNAAKNLLAAAMASPSVAVAPEVKPDTAAGRTESVKDVKDAKDAKDPKDTKGTGSGSDAADNADKEAGTSSTDRVKVAWFAGVVALVAAIIFLTIALTSKTATPSIYEAGNGPGAIYITDATPGATIHYTTDGSDPTTSSPIYDGPLKDLTGETSVRAIATSSGHATSDIASHTYYVPYEWSIALNHFNRGKDLYNSRLYAQARASFLQACNGSEMHACNYLGYMYAEGLGGPRNEKRAGALFEKACSSGIMAACVSLGKLEEVAGNTYGARAHYQEACNGGNNLGCQYLQQLH